MLNLTAIYRGDKLDTHTQQQSYQTQKLDYPGGCNEVGEGTGYYMVNVYGCLVLVPPNH